MFAPRTPTPLLFSLFWGLFPVSMLLVVSCPSPPQSPAVCITLSPSYWSRTGSSVCFFAQPHDSNKTLKIPSFGYSQTLSGLAQPICIWLLNCNWSNQTDLSNKICQTGGMTSSFLLLSLQLLWSGQAPDLRACFSCLT